VLIFTHVRLIAKKNLSQMRSGYDRAVSSFSSHYAHISHECFAEVLAGQSNSLRSRSNCTAFSDYQRVCETGGYFLNPMCSEDHGRATFQSPYRIKESKETFTRVQ